MAVGLSLYSCHWLGGMLLLSCSEAFPKRHGWVTGQRSPWTKLTKQTIIEGGRYDTSLNNLNRTAVFSLTLAVYSPRDVQRHREGEDALTLGWRLGLRETDELWSLIDIPGTGSQRHPHANNINTQDCYCISPSWDSHEIHWWTVGLPIDLMPVAKARHVCAPLH